jgi:hypothetical protein
MYTCKQRERDIDYQPRWVDAFNAVFFCLAGTTEGKQRKRENWSRCWEVKIDRKYRQAGF